MYSRAWGPRSIHGSVFTEIRLRDEDANWPGGSLYPFHGAHYAVFYARSPHAASSTPHIDTYCEDGSPWSQASERLGSVIKHLRILGQGLSVGAGMAAALKQRGSDSRVYVMLGDGELQEGQVWEAATAAGNWQLDNLCLIIDANDMQVEGHVNAVQPNEPLADKWQAFAGIPRYLWADIPAIQRALDPRER